MRIGWIIYLVSSVSENKYELREQRKILAKYFEMNPVATLTQDAISLTFTLAECIYYGNTYVRKRRPFI